MPNLPETYQSQVAPQANRRIVETPTFGPDFSMGNALQDVGKAALEITTRIKNAETDQQLVKAEVDARSRLDKLQFDLEADAETPDTAIPVRFKQESEAILKEVAGTISSESARNLWLARARGWQAEGENKSIGLSRKRQVDKVRAGHIAMAADLDAKAGDLAISSDTYAASLGAARAALKRDVERGMMDADTAAQREAQLDLLAKKDTDLRTTQNVDALLGQGRVAEARAQFMANYANMTPEIRARTEAGLKASEQDFAVVEKSDSIWDQAKGDYGKAMELASKEKDAPTRLKIEQRIGQKMTQAKAVEDARQDALQAELWKHVVNGGTIMSASAAVRGAIDPNRMGAIRAYENARDAEKGMTAAEKARLTDRSKDIRFIMDSMADMNPSMFMAGPENWPAETRNYYNMMTADDMRAVDTQIQEMRQKGPTASATKEVFNVLLDEAKRVVPEWRLGSDADPKKLPKEGLQFAGVLRAQAETISKDKGGKPLSVDEARDAVARALRVYQPDKWLSLPTNERDIWMDKTSASFGYDEMAEARNEIRAEFLRTYKREPTPAEVQSALAKLQGN